MPSRPASSRRRSTRRTPTKDSATGFLRSGASARSATSSTASCSWSHRRTSPARSCTSTAARSRAARPTGLLAPPTKQDDLAGGYPVPDAGDLPSGIEDQYAARPGELPDEVHRLVLLAAADPVGDPALIVRAAGVLGLDTGTVDLPAVADLLGFGVNARPASSSAFCRLPGRGRALDGCASLRSRRATVCPTRRSAPRLSVSPRRSNGT